MSIPDDDDGGRPQRHHAETDTTWEWDDDCGCWWLVECSDECVAVEVGPAELGGYYWHVSFMDGSSMDGREGDEMSAFGEAVDAMRNPVPPGRGPPQ